jgi:Trypsin-co-occurring domain 1
MARSHAVLQGAREQLMAAKSKTKSRSGAKSSAGVIQPAKDWTLTLLVPTTEADNDEEVRPGPQTNLHARGMIGWIFGAEEKPVESSEVKQQWADTISGIVATVGEWSAAQSNQWKIEEVTFGLTLSAKGRLMFIAEASAQGSVQVKLKRAPGAARG